MAPSLIDLPDAAKLPGGSVEGPIPFSSAASWPVPNLPQTTISKTNVKGRKCSRNWRKDEICIFSLRTSPCEERNLQKNSGIEARTEHNEERRRRRWDRVMETSTETLRRRLHIPYEGAHSTRRSRHLAIESQASSSASSLNIAFWK